VAATGLVEGARLFGAAVFVVAVTCAYVHSESTVYYWDYGGYEDIAGGLTDVFRQSSRVGWVTLYRTLSNPYNAVFALPLTPVIRLFGEHRLSYELGIALLYQLPYVLVLGSVAALLSDGPRRRIDWTATTVALLLPALWAPVLRGFPDSLSALLFALAVRAYLEDMSLQRRWQIPAIAILLAASAVVRRHFLLAIPPFLIAATVTTFLANRSSRHLVRGADALGRASAIAACAIAAPWVLAPRFVDLLLSNDHYDLYTSYLESTTRTAASFCAGFGGITIVAAVAGFIYGLRKGILRWRPTLFVLITFSLTTVVWFAVVRQIGLQYLLHLAPLIVFGLQPLARGALVDSTPRGLVALVAGATFLLASLAFALCAPPTADLVSFASLLPRPLPPLVRADLGKLHDMLTDLRALARSREPVLVVASSDTISADILRRAEKDMFGRSGVRLEFLEMPQVDSRDPYPMPELLAASYVVLATPVQLQLTPEEQDLVTLTNALFHEGRGLARDFAPVASYQLERGVVATLLRRSVPPSLQNGLATLLYYEEGIPHPSASQPDWVVVSAPHRSYVRRIGSGATEVVLHASSSASLFPAVAVHAPGPDGALGITGRLVFVEPQCAGVEILFGALQLTGTPEPVARVTRRPGDAEDFSAVVHLSSGERLSLMLTLPPGQDSSDHCLTKLEDLHVTRVNSSS
jgi:hypothetical protein